MPRAGLFPIMAIGVLAVAQDVSPDGRTSAKWGMTEEQIMAAFPSAQGETIGTTDALV